MPSSGPRRDPGPTLRQRAEDLHERAMLGGVFYLLSWLLLAGFGNGWSAYPRLSAVLAFVFVALLAARLLIRRQAAPTPRDVASGIRRQWAVLLLTAGLWGGIAFWAYRDPVFADARLINLLATVSLSTAFAQIFAVNPRLSLLGTGALYLPLLGAVALDGQQWGLLLVMVLNLVYLIAVIARSHREYEGKLAVDEALRQQRDRFELLSRTDALTGLANRGHFQQHLDDWLAAARDNRDGLQLLIADIDHFKAINDGHGHAAGDACLREVATRLRTAFAGVDTVVARLGGEEFGVLARGADATGLAGRAEAFRRDLASHAIAIDARHSVQLTTSLGLAAFVPDRHEDPDALYRSADEALYRAKAGGRDRLLIADASTERPETSAA